MKNTIINNFFNICLRIYEDFSVGDFGWFFFLLSSGGKEKKKIF